MGQKRIGRNGVGTHGRFKHMVAGVLAVPRVTETCLGQGEMHV